MPRPPSTTSPTHLAALGYFAEGLRVVPIPAGRKGPVIEAWQYLRLTPDDFPLHFSNGGNIGMLTGEASRGVVDVDLDSKEARLLAPYILPATSRICGRVSSKASHWFYLCDPIPDTKKFEDPIRRGEDGRSMLVEVRGSGLQTMVPPSTHPDGELVTWEKEGAFTLLHGGVLLAAAARLAAISLTAYHWPGVGGRQKAALALGGAFAHHGWGEEEARRFVELAAMAAGDEEADDRAEAVRSSYLSLAMREEVTGIPTLITLLPKRVVDAIVNWLGLRDQNLERELAAFTNGSVHLGEAPPSPSPTPTPTSRTTTDLGNGERFSDQHGHEVRYSFGRGKWYAWVGTHWQEDRMGAVDRLAARTARSVLHEAAGEPDPVLRRSLVAWAKVSEAQGKRDAMLKSAAPMVVVDEQEFDGDAWVLNCLNGTVDLHTGSLRPHCPDDLLSKCCHAAYLPEPTCPTWLSFLSSVMRNRPHLVTFLQRALGYTLTGMVGEHVLFFLYGTGRNGKSTFIHTIRAVLGDYAMQAAPDLLLAKNAQAHPTELADLFRRRFVASVEAGMGKRLDEQLVKHLTGGEAVRARRMREDFWEFEPTHKLWLAANHKPVIKGADTGIWSRIKTIPFDVFIPEEERDVALDQKLQREASGILAWMVEGCLAWQREGLGAPEEVRAATAQYRSEMDVLDSFLDDCCEFGERHTSSIASLYAEYARWCIDMGERAVSKRVLGIQLDERGFGRTRIGHAQDRGHLGLRLTDRSPQVDKSEAIPRLPT